MNMGSDQVTNEPLDVMVLAAGLGTRMRSNKAKVLHRLGGRPLINHVCRTALKLNPRKIYIVVGHQAEEVKTAVLDEMNEDQVVFVTQKSQLGTGDAVNSVKEAFKSPSASTAILCQSLSTT